MTVQERQDYLIKQISNLQNIDILTMLEQELVFFTHLNGSDIVDGLNHYQTNELISLVNEPSDSETINEEEYLKATRKWRSK